MSFEYDLFKLFWGNTYKEMSAKNNESK
jgi:hypothetical protein